MLFCVAMLQTCREKPVDNNDDDKPGRRDYTWTIDTLSYPGSLQTTMREMYAVNEKNIYVVGHNERGYGKMYHYNGIEWTDVKLTIAEGGTILGGIDLSAIYGFGVNDIWAVGARSWDNINPPPNYIDSSLIIHFDGTQWREVFPDIRSRGKLQGIWGNVPNDIWTGGLYGSLFHYDGNNWKKVNVDSSLWYNALGGNMNKQFLTAYKQIDTSGYITGIKYMFKKVNDAWFKIDSFALLPNSIFTFGHLNIQSISGTIYSSGYGLFYQKNEAWLNIQNISGVIRYTFGTRTKNIYAVGNAGAVYHFNGINWQKLEEFNNSDHSFTAGWTNEKEVFIMGENNSKTFIYHGK